MSPNFDGSSFKLIYVVDTLITIEIGKKQLNLFKVMALGEAGGSENGVVVCLCADWQMKKTIDEKKGCCSVDLGRYYW